MAGGDCNPLEGRPILDAADTRGLRPPVVQSSRRSVASWMAVALAALVAAQPAADARCRSTCTDERRACRTQCAPLRGVDRRQCRRRCADTSTCAAPGAPLPVLAYAANEYVEDAHDLVTVTQKLVVRRGNCDPVTVMSASGQFQDTLRMLIPERAGLWTYGDLRIGSLSSISGRFQALGVLPPGKGVVFG